jgi:flagellar FliL protein
MAAANTARYFSFAEDFTSNLRDSDALVQTSIAASTRRDYRVMLWLKKHELALRSAILADLADTPEADIHTAEGKDRLQKRLTATINKVLTSAEGFGGSTRSISRFHRPVRQP